MFILVWADNGDILSKQYAGTGALKSDFTRTGQRTVYGAMRDGVNSLYRYLINNFYDGSKQVSRFVYLKKKGINTLFLFLKDAIDLFLGNYQIVPGEGVAPESSPVSVEKNKRFLAVSLIL
jgi:hypothetical protein